MVEDRRDDLDDGLGLHALPSGLGPDVDAALGDVGSGGAVERDDDRDGTGTLAIGAVVVSARVVDPVVGV